MLRISNTNGAPMRRCTSCGQDEHGSVACGCAYEPYTIIPANGTMPEYETGTIPPEDVTPFATLLPFMCPVCMGSGRRGIGHYDGTVEITEVCKPCGGVGVIWGPPIIPTVYVDTNVIEPTDVPLPAWRSQQGAEPERH